MPIDMKLVISGQFKELVRRGNVDKITVTALIEECHISRQTFYYHFQDINDVMEWSVRRETEQLLRQSLELPQLRCGLELLFIRPDIHGRGLGQSAWQVIQQAYPRARVWEVHTPYFDKRNIHFYVNKCGFHIVEFYCDAHPLPHASSQPIPGGDVFFRFEKQMEE